jgi:sugar O-acyltransferase (sialic acid O-acetyltransferase NeuD family)
MTTLYLCGAGNPEGVRLALTINRTQSRWDRIILLDDDPSKQGQSILGVEIAGPFNALEQADAATDEVSNLVARTTRGRQSALLKIQAYGLPFAQLIHPGVDIMGVGLGRDITVYQDGLLFTNATVGEGSVVLARAIVGHGCHVDQCCVIGPGAVINARVELGDGVYFGTNASILPDLKIGPWATIGANSAVVQDVPAGATVMGVPAEILIPGSRDFYAESSDSLAGEQRGPERFRDSTKLQPEGTEIQSEALKRLRAAQQKYIEDYRSTKS